MKKIFFVISLFFSYFIINQYISVESNPCDIECDNCISSEQCEQCYNDCYSKIR